MRIGCLQNACGRVDWTQCNSEDVTLVEASLLKVIGSVAVQDGGSGISFWCFGSLFEAPNPVRFRDVGRPLQDGGGLHTAGALTPG